MRCILFCEARADAETAQFLVGEALCHRVEWLREHRDASTWESVGVSWCVDEAERMRSWFDLHSVDAYLRRLGVKPLHGHIGGRAAEPGAKLLSNIDRLVRRLRQRGGDAAEVEAVLVVWDADNQARARAAGLDQSLAMVDQTASRWVLGMPTPMREAWVLVGFEPQSDAEHTVLAGLRRSLGFEPCVQPERLTSTDATSARHPKMVLSALIGDDADRERLCLRIGSEARWQRLTTVGAGCGLAEFLRRIVTVLGPAFEGPRE